MKITILNGSPRDNGATGKILKAMREKIEELGSAEVEYVNISDCEIRACLGCEKCYENGACPICDDTKKINRHIAESQGVIIGSPTYVSNVPGALKTYIDRGHIVLEQAYRDKHTMAVVTYEIGGGRNVIRALNSMFRYAGGATADSFLLKLNHNSNPFENPKTLAAARDAAECFYHAIRNNRKKSLLDMITHYIATKHVMGPAVLHSPKRYAAVVENFRV
jgi:multimeric flavodoxin WrbA